MGPYALCGLKSPGVFLGGYREKWGYREKTGKWHSLFRVPKRVGNTSCAPTLLTMLTRYSFLFMAFALSALEAAEVAAGVNNAVVFGTQGARLADFAAHIGAGVTGALGLGTIAGMTSGKKRSRSGTSTSNKKRRTTQNRNARSGGFLGLERKFFDTEHAAAIVGTVAGSEFDNGTSLAINAVGQGDAENNRENKRS